MARIAVDYERCSANGVCTSVAPDWFTLDEKDLAVEFPKIDERFYGRPYNTAFFTSGDSLWTFDTDDLAAGPIAQIDLPFQIGWTAHGHWMDLRQSAPR